MNRIIIITLALVSFNAKAKHQKLNLQKAMEQHLVKAKANSLGGYQGYCMNLNLISLSPDSLIVYIEAGRRLNSTDDKNQDILIVKEEIIVLSKLENKWVKVKGYCCQANNHSPSQNAKYDINTLADSSLVTLARYLNAGSFDAHVEQQAIWAISDKKPTANITMRNDSLSLPLRELVATLKGEPLPWYTVISRTYVFTSGVMENYPQLLRGKLNYSNDRDTYVTLFILDNKGKEVCLLKSQWMKAEVNGNYDLNVPVKSLAKGKYSIGLRTSDKELTKREFEI
ncbi:MAG: hypothetical protein H0W61_10080 [Bacteroidetes bacterium]|nr:hypothetical protein [Bacteroidota bacterium]